MLVYQIFQNYSVNPDTSIRNVFQTLPASFDVDDSIHNVRQYIRAIMNATPDSRQKIEKMLPSLELCPGVWFTFRHTPRGSQLFLNIDDRRIDMESWMNCLANMETCKDVLPTFKYVLTMERSF